VNWRVLVVGGPTAQIHDPAPGIWNVAGTLNAARYDQRRRSPLRRSRLRRLRRKRKHKAPRLLGPAANGETARKEEPMFSTTLAKPISLVAAAAGVAAAGMLIASALVGQAAGATANLRPICNSLYFNPPAAVGGKVTIPVHEFAADPDVTPVKLVSVFGGSPIGTAAISGNDLVFTLTSSTPGETYLYWTISDGSLTAQCVAYGSNAPPPDNG
jgi:hypothetical protein